MMKKVLTFLMVLILVCGVSVVSAQEIPEIVIGWTPPPDITGALKLLLIFEKAAEDARNNGNTRKHIITLHPRLLTLPLQIRLP